MRGLPKRFFGGSEDNLRGYKYYTVSPLDDEGKPIGGRSALFYSIEPRIRVSNSFGLVPFFDMGNVYLESFPTFKGKWRKAKHKQIIENANEATKNMKNNLTVAF